MRDIAERTVPAVLERGLHLWPEKPAVEAEGTSLSYRALHDQSLQVAAGLASLGVGSGECVALMMGNTIEHVLSWFGASCLNAIEVPLNTSFTSTQMSYVLRHSEARVLIVEEQYLHLMSDLAGELSALETVVVCGSRREHAGLPWRQIEFTDLLSHSPATPARVQPSDALGILYTSGTTGMPKGVVVSQAQTYGRMWPGGPGTPAQDDRTLIVLPIYHVIGQCRGLYNTLIAGGTAILEPRFSASRFWDICRRHRITFVPLVGVMVSYLLDQSVSPLDRDHPVRHVALGTTSPRVEEFGERFGVAKLSMSYGLTEAGGVLVGDAEPAGCGYLRTDFEARLVDEHDIPVPSGEVGELVLRSREPWGTMTGYYKMPQETTEKWRNLWLHTGDLMWQRDDGMFMFAGRLGERIRVRGENVSPAEVEQQLAEHPAVAECSVLGVAAQGADSAVGEQDILVAVVPRESGDIDFAGLADFARQRLPAYAVPRYYRLYESLPRTAATHRIQRSVIAAEPLGTAWDLRAAHSPSGAPTQPTH